MLVYPPARDAKDLPTYEAVFAESDGRPADEQQNRKCEHKKSSAEGLAGIRFSPPREIELAADCSVQSNCRRESLR